MRMLVSFPRFSRSFRGGIGVGPHRCSPRSKAPELTMLTLTKSGFKHNFFSSNADLIIHLAAPYAA